MPPKRAAASSASRKAPAKKSRPSTEGTVDEGAEEAPRTPTPPRDPRWAPVSGSANADMNYKLTTQNPVEAYSFCLLCEPPFDDDEKEEEDEEGDGNGSCDGGKKCLCSKPVTEHPDHPWKVSVAGKTKFFLQRVHSELRTPDSFGMYTFNDHSAYGTLEVIQNLFLDFQNAADNVKEQWAVCEALGLFMASGEGMEMTM
jgi:hypothetical protein